ncbi:DGQHR domain-containing protein DpdB [Duganella sp. CT11-25]|uniref:DGQHR domain-containing protein DpdB n=1 Tax=unclassified Duganella TaxID=2636909 RepID=UPI0039AFBFF2
MAKHEIVVRALHASQGDGLDLYAFFIRGEDIIKVADISRIERSDNDTLKGFQRPEIQQHVKGIVDYLNQGQVLFPNSIILAMSPDVRFSASRGTKPTGDAGIGQTGTLTIPIYDEGERVAWIVDGQQRSIALAQSKNKTLPVPVIAFISDSLEIQREQFILVNKAKPLPTRLINELLPETRSVLLPRELNLRKVPYEICNLLNRDPKSPFHKLIKRPSDSKQPGLAVIIDSAVTKMIRNSMNNPLGALYPYKPNGTEAGDTQAMYNIVVTFWSAVRDVFPDAWAKDPRQSRLMHSAGIEAMGVLMDRIYARLPSAGEDYKTVRKELEKIAPSCRWTAGIWESIGVEWNELQNTSRDIKKLQDALVRAYTTEVKK